MVVSIRCFNGNNVTTDLEIDIFSVSSALEFETKLFKLEDLHARFVGSSGNEMSAIACGFDSIASFWEVQVLSKTPVSASETGSTGLFKEWLRASPR